MLSINFDALRDEYPHLSQAFQTLEAWLNQHPKIRHIEPPRILRMNESLDPWELGVALGVLVDQGLLKH